ncbi:MAG: hypothetical protein HRT55_20885, partial [Colwellia sp.]|uniref:beta strand repeat-containing protein n=1 Tax=Colwellia sp. TaxID=56799 RepID=UPI0025C33F8F
ITAENKGVINDGTADEVNFVNFNALIGGTGNDDFVMGATGNVDTLIGGNGAGVDSLSARVGVKNTWTFTDAISSLTQGNTDPTPDETYVGDFSGIESYLTGMANEWADVSALTNDIAVSSYLSFAGIVGNNLTSTLIGQDVDSLWAISKVEDADGIDSSGINDGVYTTVDDTLKFIGFANLTGGNQVDDFTLALMNNITGLISGGIGEDTLTLSTVNQTVEIGTDISSIETLTGIGSNTLIASNIDNTWLINTTDQGVINNGTANEVNFVNFDKLTGGNQVDDFTLTLMDNITGLISGGLGDDTLTLNTVNQSVVIGTDISGIETVTGTGSNTLTASNIDNTWLINTTDQGVINDGTINEVNFVNFDKLTGGNQADDFSLTLMDNITGLISGGAGVDSLILGTVNQSVVIGTDISSIETVTGTGSNTLTASNIANTWLITAENKGVINDGTADEVNFVNFNTLTGGNQADDFTLTLMDNITGLISGGVGVDSLMLGTVNQTVVIGTDISGIETITGTGSNTLTASNIANTWLITAENKGVINDGTADEVNFVNFNTLTGGNQADDFTLTLMDNITGLISGGVGVDSLMLGTV